MCKKNEIYMAKINQIIIKLIIFLCVWTLCVDIQEVQPLLSSVSLNSSGIIFKSVQRFTKRFML